MAPSAGEYNNAKASDVTSVQLEEKVLLHGCFGQAHTNHSFSQSWASQQRKIDINSNPMIERR